MLNKASLLPPKGTADVILDTDTYNEIDDQFAIAYLLQNGDRLHCLGLCAAPFYKEGRSNSAGDGMRKSYDEIHKVLALMGRDEVPVFAGSDCFLPDEQTPVHSAAAEYIIASARRYSPDHPLYVVAIGAITNVASALLIAPEIKDNIVVVWLSGATPEQNLTNEFNMAQDIAAARVVMGSGALFVQLPCWGVVDVFTTDETELAALYDTTPIADYLARSTVKFCDPTGDHPGWKKVIWDVTAIGWLLNEGNGFMTCETRPMALPGYDGHLEPHPSDFSMGYVSKINRHALMKDLFAKLVH